MEQNFDSNTQSNLPKTPKKFPTWAIAFILVVALVLVVGLATYPFINKGKKVTDNNKVSLTQNSEVNISGDYGPYNFDNKSQEVSVSVSVSVSDHNWGVIFQNLGKYHVVVNKEEKDILDNPISNFKVTDKFYGFIYPKDGKWYVKINNKNYGPFDDNVELLMSNNYWAIKYFDNTSQHDKAIVNDKVYDDFVKQIYVSDNFAGVVYSVKKNGNSDWDSFVVLNDKIYGPYPSSWISLSGNKDSWLINFTREPGSSLVIVNGKEYTLDLGDTYLENCEIYSSDLWACEYPGKDSSWHVIMYENGNKKEYGPYGKFSDPREQADLIMTKNGFMFNFGKQLIINVNGDERKVVKSDISYVQASDNHMGYFYTQEKNNYVNIDAKDYGPYEFIDNFLITDKGWGFNYLKDGKTIALVNGIAFDAVGVISISKNNWAIGYQKDEKLYIKIGNN